VKAELFVQQYDADLANGVGNVASRVLGMLEKYNGGHVPEGELPSDYRETYLKVLEIFSLPESDPLSVFDLISRIRSHVQFLDQDIARHQPWVAMKDGLSQDLDNHFVAWLEGLRVLSLLLAPVLPTTADTLRGMLGLPLCSESQFLFSEELNIPVIVPGAELGKRRALFPRLR